MTDRQNAAQNPEGVNREIRRMALSRRAALKDRHEKEKALVKNLMPFFEEAKLPGFFMPVRFEPEIRPLFSKFPGHLLPRVVSETEMVFWPALRLKPGSFNIPEPDDPALDQLQKPEISAEMKEEIRTRYVPDVLLVPLSVFHQTWRMGYGKGFYDRYLNAHPEIKTVGCAFDEQEAAFCVRPWDVPLDFIVTPTRIIKKGQVPDNREKGEDES